MPKLLQISIEVNSGSVGRIAEQIGEVAMSRGWNSYITYARHHRSSKSYTLQIGTYWDVYWHGIMTRLFDAHCKYSRRATKRLIKQIERIQPDIIQLHHIHGYYLNMNVLFNYLSSVDIPVVWIFHDCWSITGHCAHFDYIGCDKWKTQCFACPQKKEYPGSFFLDRSRKNYIQKKELFTSVKNMTIVPVSYWLGNIVKESFLKDYSCQVIQNGIDTDVFSPQQNVDVLRKKLNIGECTVLLGVASTWEKRKGLDDFIELSGKIPADWVIILVGLNKKQIRRLPERVIGIERTENVQQLAAFYTLADVFINPTWEDTFPTTNLEALACGTPVITYRTGGSVESISKETGFIVEKGDLEGVMRGVYEVIKKGKKAYSSVCRERAVSLYNKKDRFKDYMELYDRLINR